MTTSDKNASIEDLQAIAVRIAKQVRELGIDAFRDAIKEAMVKRFEVIKKQNDLENARLEFLKANGELKSLDELSDPPDNELPIKWFPYSGVIRGSISWPKNFSDSVSATERFEYVKKRGFPNETRGKESTIYSFRVCCWIPNDFHPKKDPPPFNLLPVPSRRLKPFEKLAILAAIHDVYWKGDEKIAPWGLSIDGAAPEFRYGDLSEEEQPLAIGYISLFSDAKEIRGSDLRIIEVWLGDLEANSTNGKAKALETEVKREDRPTKTVDKPPKKKRHVWLAQAMLLVRDNPDWSNAKIAKEVGVHPSTLSRSQEYQAAAKLARGDKRDRLKGKKIVDPTTGLHDVESYSNDDPAERDWEA